MMIREEKMNLIAFDRVDANEVKRDLWRVVIGGKEAGTRAFAQGRRVVNKIRHRDSFSVGT
jgi:hypothetical protein